MKSIFLQFAVLFQTGHHFAFGQIRVHEGLRPTNYGALKVLDLLTDSDINCRNILQTFHDVNAFLERESADGDDYHRKCTYLKTVVDNITNTDSTFNTYILDNTVEVQPGDCRVSGCSNTDQCLNRHNRYTCFGNTENIFYDMAFEGVILEDEPTSYNHELECRESLQAYDRCVFFSFDSTRKTCTKFSEVKSVVSSTQVSGAVNCQF